MASLTSSLSSVNFNVPLGVSFGEFNFKKSNITSESEPTDTKLYSSMKMCGFCKTWLA